MVAASAAPARLGSARLPRGLGAVKAPQTNKKMGFRKTGGACTLAFLLNLLLNLLLAEDEPDIGFNDSLSLEAALAEPIVRLVDSGEGLGAVQKRERESERARGLPTPSLSEVSRKKKGGVEKHACPLV